MEISTIPNVIVRDIRANRIKLAISKDGSFDFGTPIRIVEWVGSRWEVVSGFIWADDALLWPLGTEDPQKMWHALTDKDK